MDGPTWAILRIITQWGYAVLARNREQAYEVVAINSESGERYGVIDADPYRAAYHLAEILGRDFGDD